MNPRDAGHRVLNLCAWRRQKLRLSRDYVCINTPIISQEEGATGDTSIAQWRHPVMMMVMTSLNDRDHPDSRNVTCSSWQHCVKRSQLPYSGNGRGQTK